MIRIRTLMLTALSAMLLMGQTAWAGNFTVSFSDSVPMQLTDWLENMTIPQLNPADYAANPLHVTLNSVKIELTADVFGDLGYENLDNNAADIDMTLEALVSVADPFSAGTLVSGNPSVSVSAPGVPAFDGVLDNGGTSGATFGGISANDMNMVTFVSNLAGYVGSGNVTFAATGLGLSSGTASGNAALDFLTNAGATLKVTYDVTVVPEPATAGLAAFGMLALLGVGLVRRRHG